MVKKRKKTAVKAARSIRLKVKRPAKPARAKLAKKKDVRLASGVALEKVGVVTHYFPHVNAAAVKLMKSGVAVGDKIYIKGHTTDFKEKVSSMQLDHVVIDKGRKGQEIGLFVKSRVRIGDRVYKV